MTYSHVTKQTHTQNINVLHAQFILPLQSLLTMDTSFSGMEDIFVSFGKLAVFHSLLSLEFGVGSGQND